MKAPLQASVTMMAQVPSLLDLLPPPSPLVLYPSLLSEQGIHSLAFHPLLPWEPSLSLSHPAFVHPLSPRLCLGNIDPLVARFVTPPHLTRLLNLLLKAPSPTLLCLAFVHPPSPRLRLGNVDTLAAVTCSTP